VAGRSTRSLDVTMSDLEQPAKDGPSERAVAISRAWLVILGVAFVAFGVGIMVTAEGSDQFWGIGLAAAGVLNFIAARYARGRFVVFLGSFGP
jgi:hypothetical protein